MTDTPNPFNSLFKMGTDMVKAFGPAAEALSPENLEKLWPTMPKEMMELFMGKSLNPEALDAKTKLLLTLQGLTIQGALAEPQIRLTIRHLRELETTDQEVIETIALAGLFGGAPSVAKAMKLFEAIKAEEGLPK